ncbi:MAG: hypothetical protein HQL31_03175 [Planctomycetes bacterium]|nr:hypothetical protein [Planctomycetota bacterium]
MLLAVDPSINDMGLCLLDDAGRYLSSLHLAAPRSKGILASTRLEFLAGRTLDFVLSRKGEISEVVIEHSRFFSRSQLSSHASAQKLNLAKGMAYGICRAHLDCPVHLAWIPGFSKQNALLLARTFILPGKLSQHEIDAFWLGNTWVTTHPVMRAAFTQFKDT